MIKFKKAIVSIGLSAIMVTSFSSTSFASYTAYEKINEEIISSGVIHKNTLKFTKNGWLNLNSIHIDLNNDNTELDILTSSKGISSKETLSSMVDNEDDVVAAMNGDFFYMMNPDSPLGAIIEDNKIISSPVNRENGNNFATFYVNNTGQAFADYCNYNLSATTSSGAQIPITSINKYTDKYQYTMLIDKNWGANSPGYSEDLKQMVEVVVIDDTIKEIRKNQPSVEIPEDGYILLAAKENSPWAQSDKLLSSVNVGDKITINTDITPNIENIKLALGGGTVLVKDGQVAPFTQTVSGAHPRSAIGITKDRSQLILVTIDGRHTSYKGVNGKELANILIELGSHEAIIMDGGGSSTMITRNQGEFDPKVINNPSEGIERRIINGIAVKSNSSSGNVEGIKTEIDNDKSFVGASREINVKAFDENYNPVNVNQFNVNLRLKSGEGFFNSNSFTPTKPGKTIIEAEYMGATSEVVLNVLDDLSHIEVNASTNELKNNQSISFNVIGVSSDGYRAKINSKDVIWKDLRGLGSFKDGVYTAGSKSGATKLEAKFRNYTTNISIAVGSNTSIINDFESLNVDFISYPKEVKGSISLDSNAKEGRSALKLRYDFTGSDSTRAAYIKFDDDETIISNPANSVGVWAYVDTPATHLIRGRVKDADGVDHVIDFRKNADWTGWKHITADLPNNMTYPIELERLYVVETDSTQKTKGEIVFDNLEVSYSIGITADDSNIFNDKLNRPYETEGNKFFIHSGIQYDRYTLLDRLISSKISNLINKDHEISLFTGDIDETISDNINKEVVSAKSGYKYIEKENSLILQLDNLKDGIRKTNYDQWPWLQNLLKNTNKDNIFIVMSKPIVGSNGFSDELEADLLMDTFTEAYEEGKQVFVLYEGEDIAVDVINGVRYISTGQYSIDDAKHPKEAFRYIEFNINDEEVTYQIKSLFE